MAGVYANYDIGDKRIRKINPEGNQKVFRGHRGYADENGWEPLGQAIRLRA